MDIFTSTKETVTGTARNLFSGARGIAEQTRQGWKDTTEQVELPDWMQKILRIHEEIGEGSKEGGEPGGEPPKQSRSGLAVGVSGGTAAAYGYDQSDEEDPRTGEETAR